MLEFLLEKWSVCILWSKKESIIIWEVNWVLSNTFPVQWCVLKLKTVISLILICLISAHQTLNEVNRLYRNAKTVIIYMSSFVYKKSILYIRNPGACWHRKIHVQISFCADKWPLMWTRQWLANIFSDYISKLEPTGTDELWQFSL